MLIDIESLARKNIVWLNPENFSALFGAGSKEPHFIEIARQVYQVAALPELAKETIGLSRTHFDVLQSKRVMIVPFIADATNTADLKEATIELAPLNDAPYLDEPQDRFLNLEELRAQFRQQFASEILRRKQPFIFNTERGSFKAALKEGKGEGKKAPYGRLIPGTKLDFIPASGSQIAILEQEINRNGSDIHCHLSLERKKPEPGQEWDKEENLLPVLLDRNLFEQSLRNQKCVLRIGDEQVSPQKPYPIRIKVHHIQPKTKEGKAAEASLYQQAHAITDTSKITFCKSEEIFLANFSDPVKTSQLTFAILDATLKNKEDKEPSFVSAALLKEKMENRSARYVLGERFVLEVGKRKFLLKVDDAKASESLKGMSPNEAVYWRDPDTKVNLTIPPHFPIKLVDSEDAPFPVKRIKITLNQNTSSKKTELLVLTEPLNAALLKGVPDKVYKGQQFTLQSPTGIEYSARVDDLEFVLPPKKMADYTYLGYLDGKTSFEFSSEKAGALTVIKPQPILSTKDLEQRFLEMNLGGLSKQFQQIMQEIIFSRSDMKEIAQARGIKPARGLLLYGPPGTGKTTIARNLGKILGVDEDRIQMISAPEIWAKWLGESEEKIRALFAPAREAQKLYKDKSPLFVTIIDEIDAISGRREETSHETRKSVLDQLLGEIDGLHVLDNHLLIGMTNLRGMIDPALLRPGRLGTHVKIDLPDQNGRLQILEIYTKPLRDKNLLHPEVDLNYFAEHTNKWSGALLEGLVQRASLYSLVRLSGIAPDKRANHPDGFITHNDFVNAYNNM